MRSSSMPDLTQNSVVNSKDTFKIKKMMRNHHFNFGTQKADFSSTFQDNFTVHNLKSNFSKTQLFIEAKAEPSKTLMKSKSQSSVPLSTQPNNSTFKFQPKVGATLQLTSNAKKGLKYYIPTTTRANKQASNVQIGFQRPQKDDYQTTTASAIGGFPNLTGLQKGGFVGKIENENRKEELNKFSKGSDGKFYRDQ